MFTYVNGFILVFLNRISIEKRKHKHDKQIVTMNVAMEAVN